MQRLLLKNSIPLLLIGLALLCAAPADAQTVDDLQLLPPIGSSTPDATNVTDEIVQPGVVIEEESPGWQWVPSQWFARPIWEFGAELGINGSEGNAQAFSILAGANGKRETEGHLLEWSLKYGKTQTGGLETQHFALLNTRWDWKITPMWQIYNKNFLEYDEFKAFDLRVAPSAGLGYNLFKSDTTTLAARLGAGASVEIGGPDNNWVPEANAGVDYEQQLTPRQKVKLTSDFYPAWENFHDYRLVTDAFWEILLDETSNLSLKIGAIDRYDSTPNGRLANDIDYFVTLIWKR